MDSGGGGTVQGARRWLCCSRGSLHAPLRPVSCCQSPAPFVSRGGGVAVELPARCASCCSDWTLLLVAAVELIAFLRCFDFILRCPAGLYLRASFLVPSALCIAVLMVAGLRPATDRAREITLRSQMSGQCRCGLWGLQRPPVSIGRMPGRRCNSCSTAQGPTPCLERRRHRHRLSAILWHQSVHMCSATQAAGRQGGSGDGINCGHWFGHRAAPGIRGGWGTWNGWNGHGTEKS